MRSMKILKQVLNKIKSINKKQQDFLVLLIYLRSLENLNPLRYNIRFRFLFTKKLRNNCLPHSPMLLRLKLRLVRVVLILRLSAIHCAPASRMLLQLKLRLVRIVFFMRLSAIHSAAASPM